MPTQLYGGYDMKLKKKEITVTKICKHIKNSHQNPETRINTNTKSININVSNEILVLCRAAKLQVFEI